MTTYLLDGNGNKKTGTDGVDVFNGAAMEGGTTGGVDTLNGGLGDDEFWLDSNNAGSVNGGGDTDRVKLYGYNLGTTSFSNVETLDILNASLTATLAQINAFSTITDSVNTDASLTFYLTGVGGTVNLGAKLTAGLSVIFHAGAATSGVTVTGSANADEFYGSNAADVFSGGGGGDYFQLGNGDRGNGGADADRFDIFSQTTIKIDGGTGADRISLGTTLTGGTINGGDDTDTLAAGGQDLGGVTYSNIEVLDLLGGGSINATAAQLSSFSSITNSENPTLQFYVNLRGSGAIDFSSRVTGGHSVYARVAETATGAFDITGTKNGDTISGIATGIHFADTLKGAGGNDTIGAGEGDSANGGAGNDDITATDDRTSTDEPGHVTMSGGSGNDTLTIGFLASGTINGGDGDDTVVDGVGNYWGNGNLGTLTFKNVETLDVVGAHAYATTAQLNAFAHIINSQQPTAMMSISLQGPGGTIDFSSRLDVAVYADASGYMLGDGPHFPTGGFTVTATAWDDVLKGYDFDDTFIAGDGKDTIVAGGGEDVINGGDGDDNIDADSSEVRQAAIASGEASGNNTVNAGAGNDTINSGFGHDVLRGGTGDDWFDVYNSAVEIIELAGEGHDTVQARQMSVDLRGTAVEDLLIYGPSTSGHDDGTGNELNNYIRGSLNINILRGLEGNDTLDGGIFYSGHDESGDTLRGGAGDDTYLWHGYAIVDEKVTGSDGDDTVSSDRSVDLADTDYFKGDIENATVTGAFAADVSGNGLANELTGNSAKNALRGLAGNDTLSGGVGSDTLDGGTGADTAIYIDRTTKVIVSLDASGNGTAKIGVETDTLISIERIVGGSAGDNISGGNNANRFFGGNGNDTLNGGGGADTIIGGQGKDSLSGGADEDQFDFSKSHSGITSASADVISDWSTVDSINTAIAGTSSNYYEHSLTVSVDTIEEALVFAEANAGSSIRHAFLFNSTTDVGYLLMDLDSNGAFETGVILNKAGTASEFSYADLI